MVQTLSEVRIPPSCRLVLKALSQLKIGTISQIEVETGLPLRTIQSALHKLIELELVMVKVCLTDSRRRFYCYVKA